MKHRQIRTCSIFGQIEGIVADQMAAEGLVRKIPPESIPLSVRYDDEGRPAHCALMFPDAETEALFDRKVRALRA